MTRTATSSSTQTVELWYQGDLVGQVDFAGAFQPANEDDVWMNQAIVQQLAP